MITDKQMIKRLYLSCKQEGIECRYGKPGSFDDCDITICKTKKDLLSYVKQHPYDICTCSSSMDFPAEYTDDPEIIKLCDALRNE